MTSGLRVGIVVGICVERDAISAAACGQAQMLEAFSEVDSVTLFTTHLDRQIRCNTVVAGDAWTLLQSPAFQACDLIIFHWGIYTPLFDAIWAVDRPKQRTVVHFHNVTPIELVPGPVQQVIRQSLAQIEALTTLDLEVWTFSDFNEQTLISVGVPPERIAFVPFVIEPPRGLTDRRSASTVDVLCVGRFTPAKGTDVLVDALALLETRTPGRYRLTLVGNRSLSDPDFVERLDRSILEAGLQRSVQFLEADDDALWSLYERSHIVVSPSLHEGLCVPIIEGYWAGCHAVGTTCGNLPYVVQAPDPVVAPRDPVALADAIARSADLGTSDEVWRRSIRDLCNRFSAAETRRRLHWVLTR